MQFKILKYITNLRMSLWSVVLLRNQQFNIEHCYRIISVKNGNQQWQMKKNLVLAHLPVMNSRQVVFLGKTVTQIAQLRQGLENKQVKYWFHFTHQVAKISDESLKAVHLQMEQNIIDVTYMRLKM